MSHRVFRLSPVMLCLAILPAALTAEPVSKSETRMAVLPFRAKEGASQSLADFVGDLVATGMVKTKLVTVIDRQAIDAVLKEQAFQKTGCTDESCAVQIGKLLAANKIMTGEILKSGNTIVINARIVDVEKASVEFAESVTSRSLDDLEKDTRKLAAKIAGRIMGIDSDRLLPKEQSLWSHLWRSMLLPGWGQYHKEDRATAYAFFGGWVGLFALDYIQYQKTLSARSAYEGSTPAALVGLQAVTSGPTYDAGAAFGVQYALVATKRQDFENAQSRLTTLTVALSLLWIVSAVNSLVADAPQATQAPSGFKIHFAVNPANHGRDFFFAVEVPL